MESLQYIAYCYLRHPILSSGETMLQYAIQHLCFTGSIRLEQRRVPAHPKDPHLVSRKLLTRTFHSTTLTRSEQFALDLFPVGRSISLGQLRGTIKKQLPDLEVFKYDLMCPDLKAVGFLTSRFARTSRGRDSMQAVRAVRKFVDRRIDQLLKTERDTLIGHLNTLGSNVVLLKKETRDKLRGLLREFPDLALLIRTNPSLDITTDMHAFTVFESLSIGDSFDSGTDFGGFGGGDFGGGGDGGDW